MKVATQAERDHLERTCLLILAKNGVSSDRVSFWKILEDRTCLYEQGGKFYVGYAEPGRGISETTEYASIDEAVFRILGEEIYFATPQH